jgi:AraC family transcriptional regulator
MFTIEFRSESLQELGLQLPDRTTFDCGLGAMLWPGLRLFSSFKNQSTDSLMLEAHVFELLGAITRLDPSPEKTPPRWLKRVKERLHAEFCERLRMRDLAREAGVHPVHLARAFRKFEKRTPGEYQQHLQIRAACELLGKPEWPLAEIAAECGFADQSHFTRALKRFTGMTPAQYRTFLLFKTSD